MRSSDWSSDVCSSDLALHILKIILHFAHVRRRVGVAVFSALSLNCLVCCQQISTHLSVDELQTYIGKQQTSKHTHSLPNLIKAYRSEERRVGNECVST